MLNIVINSEYKSRIERFVNNLLDIFDSSGELVYAERNKIKLFDVADLKVNVKSFKEPHIINQIVYGNFRESKAKRSYKFAVKLIERNINTPAPLAYIEQKSGFLFKKSAYLSIQESFDGMLRELSRGTVEQHRELICQFAQFTAELHNKKVFHIDYSPGNILYKKYEGIYSFYLVDLNRMAFDEEIGMDKACHNFRRLWGNDEMMTLFVKEYARIRNFNEDECIELTFKYRVRFWKQLRRKHPKSNYYEGE